MYGIIQWDGSGVGSFFFVSDGVGWISSKVRIGWDDDFG